MERVKFRKDFWDCYWGQGKNWPIAEWRVPSNDPRKNCGTNFGSNFLLAPKGVGKKNQEERKFELRNAK